MRTKKTTRKEDEDEDEKSTLMMRSNCFSSSGRVSERYLHPQPIPRLSPSFPIKTQRDPERGNATPSCP